MNKKLDVNGIKYFTKKRFFIAIVSMLAVFFVTSCNSKDKQSEVVKEDTRPKIVNIVNFIRLLEPRDSAITEKVLYETVVKQVEIMRKYNLGGIFLLNSS